MAAPKRGTHARLKIRDSRLTRLIDDHHGASDEAGNAVAPSDSPHEAELRKKRAAPKHGIARMLADAKA